MSTIALPAMPSTARERTVSTSPAEQRIVIRDLSWDLYDQLSEAIGQHQRVFLAFDGKDMEIMVKGPEHEDYRYLISLVLEAVMTACRIRGRNLGETTWKRPEIKCGLEADQCVFFDPDKLAAVNKARMARSNDVPDYPNPDLAVEIDISQSKVDRPGIYASLRVPEIWRFDGDKVFVGQLGPDGAYHVVNRSRWLPVEAKDIRRWLVEEDSSDELAWKERLADWAKGLATQL